MPSLKLQKDVDSTRTPHLAKCRKKEKKMKEEKFNHRVNTQFVP
jgi:hypothetical protein